MSKLSEFAGVGTKDIETGVHYLRIAQKLSKALEADSPSYVKGLSVGDFYCAERGWVFGKEIDVVVLALDKSYAFFDDTEFKGATRTFDTSWVQDQNGKRWTKEGWKVTTLHNFLILPETKLNEDPIVLSLKKTDIPAARDWKNKIKALKLPTGEECPLFGGVWTLKTIKRSDGKNDWYSLCEGKGSHITFKRFLEDEEVDEVVKKYHTAQQQISASQNQFMLTASEETETDVEDSDV